MKWIKLKDRKPPTSGNYFWRKDLQGGLCYCFENKEFDVSQLPKPMPFSGDKDDSFMWLDESYVTYKLFLFRKKRAIVGEVDYLSGIADAMILEAINLSHAICMFEEYTQEKSYFWDIDYIKNIEHLPVYNVDSVCFVHYLNGVVQAVTLQKIENDNAPQDLPY
jgi:hypothetical protein